MKWTRRKSTYPTLEELSLYKCPECGIQKWAFAGYDKNGERRMKCECGRTFNKRTSA